MLKHNKLIMLIKDFNQSVEQDLDFYLNKNISLDKLLFNVHSLTNNLNKDISLLRKEK